MGSELVDSLFIGTQIWGIAIKKPLEAARYDRENPQQMTANMSNLGSKMSQTVAHKYPEYSAIGAPKWSKANQEEIHLRLIVEGS